MSETDVPSAPLRALHASVERLRGIIEALPDERITDPAYPTEWSIANTLSHIGSGAVIMRRAVEAQVARADVPDDFNQSVWDEWNAKPAAAKAVDALAADRAFMETVDALTGTDTSSLQFSIGPMSLDLDGMLGMRLSEHALHTWDIEVVVDEAATVPADAAAIVADNMAMLLPFISRPDGVAGDLAVHTVDPERDFTLAIGADRIALAPTSATDEPDLVLPAEAFVRLAYGRLDPAHTPEGVRAADLDRLRRLFPGF